MELETNSFLFKGSRFEKWPFTILQIYWASKMNKSNTFSSLGKFIFRYLVCLSISKINLTKN